MSGVRVLVGTHKGAFILSADAKRTRWHVGGPLFAGWEICHFKGSAADPDRLYASQTSGWFGQIIQRSSDGGATWEPVGNRFVYEGVPGTHKSYDHRPRPWEFKRVWHLVIRSGCRFCAASMPFYRRLVTVRDQRRAPIRMVAVGHESTEALADYLTHEGLRVDQSLGMTLGDPKPSRTPTLILVDHAGRILALWRGKLSERRQAEVERVWFGM